jgi:hypothetical protein
MTIVPETKDWTWVLDRPCPECGLDVAGIDREQVAPRTRRVGRELADLLRAADPQWVRTRPQPGTWAPLEYACHVRDAFRIFDERLRLMLETEDPDYPSWDQDATAVEDDYLGQDPAQVCAELVVSADGVADRFAGVQGAQWQRTGNRSDGARFTVESFGRYFLHDPVHHLWDLQR